MHKLSTLKRTSIALAVTQTLAVNVSSAATIIVNNGEDFGANCTLRDAIESVNAGSDLINGCTINGSLGNDDTVLFNVSGRRISLTGGRLDVDSDVSINPEGNTITVNRYSGNAEVFNVSSAGEVSIDNMIIAGASSHGIRSFGGTVTLTNSTISGNSDNGTGAGIYAFRSIFTIDNTMITGNRAAQLGAGIYSFGSVITITNSTISGNSTTYIGNYGGSGAGIFTSDSTITLSNSVVAGNFATGNGGGISAGGGTITLNNSTVSGNYATRTGGGIIVGGGTLRLNNSTVSGNSAAVEGGGIDVNSSSVVTLTSSTVSDNSGGAGGGLHMSSGLLMLTNSTISGNTAVFAGAAYARTDSVLTFENSTISNNVNAFGAGILTSSTPTITLSNSIIAGNNAGLDGGELYLNGAMFNTEGNNLLGDASKSYAQAFSGVSISSNNIVATSDGNNPTPLANILRPLANNGGPTQTHALVAASPAIDAGRNSNCPTRDQRGQLRNDGNCDIGSYEFEPEITFFVVPLPNGKSVIFGL